MPRPLARGSTSSSRSLAAPSSSALVIMTEWNQFRSLDLDRILELLRAPLVVDLRNVYQPERMRERGFAYSSVGRAAADLPRS